MREPDRMVPRPDPRGGLGLLRLTAWSLAIGLAWMLLGQQLHGQPIIHLDLTAGLPGAPPVQRPPIAPARPTPTEHRQTATPRRQAPPHRHTASQRETATSQAAARAVTFALNQQGKPYQLGAEGPGAYDCSGLTWLAWWHAGPSWERMTAADQWHWLHQHGQDVSAKQLRPGDLLFYANDPSDPASIHHVAMAIGDGRMVEAPEPGVPVHVVPVRWNGFYAAARPTR
jgi:cell wall-associated NlpC family hydrolase